MPKITAITDHKGRILGSVRSDPFETENGTLQFKALPSSDLKYHDLDVNEAQLNQSVETLHDFLHTELKRLKLV
jgi:hypothetical protein